MSLDALYQGIAKTLIRVGQNARSLTNLCERLACVADHAYGTRQLDTVGQTGQLISRLAVNREIDGAGQYYQALALNQRGHGDTVRAGLLFEQAADHAPLRYRTRAILALGANSFVDGDDRSAVSLYGEMNRLISLNRVFDPVSLCVATKMTAMIRAVHGDNQGALTLLEKMLPVAQMARAVQPQVYFDYLNALAVEFGEAGRFGEAQRASEIALASPFAPAYPEWRETLDEIKMRQRRASHSVVPVRRDIQETQNLLHLPESEPSANNTHLDRARQAAPARVLNFQRWKSMLKGASGLPAGLAPGRRRLMTTGEKLIRLMDLISRDETDDETIDRILEAVEQIVPKRRTENLD